MSLLKHQKRSSAQCSLIACRSSTSIKRRRRPLTTPLSTDAPGAASSPWASMNQELLRLIAWRVLAGDLLDYVHFRAVCTHWRSSTVSPRGHGIDDPRFHPCRWMMLPEGHGLYPAHGKLRGYIRFFNLDTGRFVRAKLPVFQDHCVLDSVNGLLVMHRDKDTVVRLFHPFTGDVVDLPPLVTLMPHIVTRDLPGASHPTQRFLYLRSVCASFSVSATGVITVMLALHRVGSVAFATNMDQQWHISTWTLWCDKPLSFQGKLYMVRLNLIPEESSEIFQVDPPQGYGDDHHVSGLGFSLPEPKLIATVPSDKLAKPIFLVECDSQILVGGYTDRSLSHMVVHRLAGLKLEKLIPLRSIGDKALFINDRCLSVSSNGALPTVVSDTIVLPSIKDGSLVEYHLNTNTWSRPMDGCIRWGPVFGPCSLIYHIYTCCRREYWNKGQLYNRSKACKWRAKGKRQWRVGA
ncbi:hypothetical protein SORBI_3004G328500 [Sorghum bicolor]|uniref:KIB1-4 beta-propeller domain-containing protein n=1 Tax=Sorghum bicolor TaxID=4558 RepID=C5XUE8_SORBI|nr:hypothetical protein SORBI_3004G328500 [Sorghum bicolor]